MIQLNPPMPFLTDKGEKVLALFALDYSPDWPTIFLCGFEGSRELWWLDMKHLRLNDNITFGRMPT